jgi:hypothetical protein
MNIKGKMQSITIFEEIFSNSSSIVFLLKIPCCSIAKRVYLQGRDLNNQILTLTTIGKSPVQFLNKVSQELDS